jgi:hypothetical protein
MASMIPLGVAQRNGSACVHQTVLFSCQLALPWVCVCFVLGVAWWLYCRTGYSFVNLSSAVYFLQHVDAKCVCVVVAACFFTFFEGVMSLSLPLQHCCFSPLCGRECSFECSAIKMPQEKWDALQAACRAKP